MYRIVLQMACFYIHILFILTFTKRVHLISIDMTLPDEPIIEGRNATLVCTVKNSKPAASITWFNGTNMMPVPADEGEEEITQEQDDGTFTTFSTFSFLAAKHDDKIRMRCRGRNLIMENRGEESLEASNVLDVQYVPRVFISPNGVLVKNYTDQLKIKCEYDANPTEFSKIVWTRNGEEIVNTDTQNATEFFVEKAKYSDNGNYSCQLTNAAGTGESIENLLVEVFHPPAVRLILSSNVLIEEENVNVTMECQVISSNPPDVNFYKWFFRGEKLHRSNEPIFTLAQIDRFDSGNYSCIAHNSLGWGEESQQQQLIIKYLPSPAHIHYYPPIIIRGNAFTLTCDIHDLGYPAARQFNWYHNDKLMVNQVKPRVIINSSITELPLKFSCNVGNELGESPHAHITIPLMTSPTFVQSLPPFYIVSETDKNVSLMCHVECSPQCRIDWRRNDRLIDESDTNYTITEIHLPENIDLNILESVASVLKWNFIHWPNGKLKREFDNANYTCISSENLIGRGVNSSVSFVVQYAPENINTSIDDVDVLEGGILDPVKCNAQAEPTASYVWLFENQTVSTNSDLNFNEGLTKEQTGIYTCKAYNSHGEVTKNVLINVQYKPQCEISTEVNTVGKVFINCQFMANPKNISIEWRFENESVTDDIISDGLTSSITFDDTVEKSGRYECTGVNFIGQTTCFSEFTTIELPSTELPSTEPPRTESSNTELPSTELPSTEPPSTEVPSTEPPNTELPSTELPSTKHPSTKFPSTELPSTKHPSTEHPSTELQSTKHPSTKFPSTELPSTKHPSTEHPSTELQSTKHPSTELSSTKHPSTKLPSTEHPSTELSRTELPSTEPLITEIPNTELSRTELPSIEFESTELLRTEFSSTVSNTGHNESKEINN